LTHTWPAVPGVRAWTPHLPASLACSRPPNCPRCLRHSAPGFRWRSRVSLLPAPPRALHRRRRRMPVALAPQAVPFLLLLASAKGMRARLATATAWEPPVRVAGRPRLVPLMYPAGLISLSGAAAGGGDSASLTGPRHCCVAWPLRRQSSSSPGPVSCSRTRAALHRIRGPADRARLDSESPRRGPAWLAVPAATFLAAPTQAGP
jgi:hypothetical protein